MGDTRATILETIVDTLVKRNDKRMSITKIQLRLGG